MNDSARRPSFRVPTEEWEADVTSHGSAHTVVITILKLLQNPEQTNLLDSCIDLNELWAGEEEQLELSIVMPCLNESETLAMCINRATGFLHQHGIAGEIIVADNGSDDGSPEIGNELGARVATAKKRGYGAALL